MEARYTIGEAAAAAGVERARLTSWLERGQFHLPETPGRGWRRFRFDDIAALAVFARCLDAGRSMVEASEAATIYRQRGASPRWFFCCGTDSTGSHFMRAVRPEDLPRAICPSGGAAPRDVFCLDVAKIEQEVLVRLGGMLQAESWRRAQALGMMEATNG